MHRPPPGPVARLRSLRYVELHTPAFAEAADFYEEVWGLTTVDSDAGDRWLRGTGDEHHVLHLTARDRVGLGRLAFAVATPAGGRRGRRRLEARGIRPRLRARSAGTGGRRLRTAVHRPRTAPRRDQRAGRGGPPAGPGRRGARRRHARRAEHHRHRRRRRLLLRRPRTACLGLVRAPDGVPALQRRPPLHRLQPGRVDVAQPRGVRDAVGRPLHAGSRPAAPPRHHTEVGSRAARPRQQHLLLLHRPVRAGLRVHLRGRPDRRGRLDRPGVAAGPRAVGPVGNGRPAVVGDRCRMAGTPDPGPLAPVDAPAAAPADTATAATAATEENAA